VLYTRGVAPTAAAATADGAIAVSAQPIDVEDRATGVHRAALIRDPDGHGLLLAQ
jgi:hypothetical protein